MKFSNRTFFSIILALLVFRSNQCHYSCLQCIQQSFSSCISCPENNTVSKQITTYSGSSTGTCATFATRVPNVLGILLLTVSMTTCSVLGGQKIFYFVLMFQTLGLLFLMEVYWPPEINFLLETFSYLMIFSYITSPIKNRLYNFKQKVGYKSIYYIKNASLSQNSIIIGPVAIVLFGLLIILPLVKACRSPSPRRCLPDWKLQKLIQGISTFFFLIIQEMAVIIYISLSTSKQVTAGDILITFFYFLGLILYIFNQCQYPLPFFRNRYSQFFTFFERILGPLFLTFPPKLQWIFYLYTFVLIIFESISTNQNKDRGKINRLFFYKFGFLLPFGATFIYSVLQIYLNSEKISKIFGIITFLAILFFVFLFLMQLLFSFQATFCPEREKKDSSVTEEGMSVEPQIQLQKKVFAGNFSIEAITIRTKKTTTEQKEQKISNNESLDHIGVTVLDFSTITVEPNLVFTLPDEDQNESEKKTKEQKEMNERVIQQNEPQEYFFQIRKKSESNITQQSGHAENKIGQIQNLE